MEIERNFLLRLEREIIKPDENPFDIELDRVSIRDPLSTDLLAWPTYLKLYDDLQRTTFKAFDYLRGNGSLLEKAYESHRNELDRVELSFSQRREIAEEERLLDELFGPRSAKSKMTMKKIKELREELVTLCKEKKDPSSGRALYYTFLVEDIGFEVRRIATHAYSLKNAQKN